MAYGDRFIKVVTSDPNIKNKIHVNIKNPNDTLYWYIKFNIALDEDSVTKDTMNVTDTEGYILETDIIYNNKTNFIAIKPLEQYVQNEYYILTISKKVCSSKGQKMKRDINIMFKLKNNVISEYKILPSNVKVPKPKKRPKAEKTNSRVYSFDKDIPNEDRGSFLPTASVIINPLIGGLGLIIAIASFFLDAGVSLIVLGIGGTIALIGVVHIFIQLFKKSFRSNFNYNRGVRKFYKENYQRAEYYFDKALALNPENEYAEYAKNKIYYYK